MEIISGEILPFERPAVATDLVLFRTANIKGKNNREYTKKLQIALIKRDSQEVENGKWSLPGGFVDIDKTMNETIYGKIAGKIGCGDFYSEQLYVVDNIGRDDRWRVISTVFIGVMNYDCGMCENEKVTWFDVNEACLTDAESGDEIGYSALAFDHGNMVKFACERLRREIFYSDIAFNFISDEFTIRELQLVYEAILGEDVNNFARTIKDRIEQTGSIQQGKAYRPAKLYRKKAVSV